MVPIPGLYKSGALLYLAALRRCVDPSVQYPTVWVAVENKESDSCSFLESADATWFMTTTQDLWDEGPFLYDEDTVPSSLTFIVQRCFLFPLRPFRFF